MPAPRYPRAAVFPLLVGGDDLVEIGGIALELMRA
jgi:hypothetical protein